MHMKNLIISILLMGLLLLTGCIRQGIKSGDKKGDTSFVSLAEALPSFASCSEIRDAFTKSQNYAYEKVAMPLVADAVQGAARESSADGAAAPAYSTTNIQVQGVDEADIVKTDGSYVYAISKGRLHIAKAYPVDSAQVTSTTPLEKVTPQEMFLSGDKLVIFGSEQIEYPVIAEDNAAKDRIAYYPYYKPSTVIQIWDITDRGNPKILKTSEIEGSYVSSRMIDEHVYFVINDYPDYYAATDSIVPQYGEDGGNTSAIAPCVEIRYIQDVPAQSFVIVGSLSVDDPGKEIRKEVIAASGQNVYVSENNLYLAEVNYNYQILPLRPLDVVADAILPPRENAEKTIIHRFSLDDGVIGYGGSMEAPGHILNQFSMDEHEGHFRIATTIGEVFRGGESKSTNNIYIFDMEGKMAGKIERLAPGERIYSTRFMGDKAYMVTFKKVDPLFVLDLTNPKEPKVLGKLKIPGYSDYLHPIDENHLIGIGKDTIEAEEGDFAWYQGVKMAIFDISDVENPLELHKVIIGDRGTESYALHDHKAFLYSKEKNLLVIPVTLAEISEKMKEDARRGGWPAYGEYTFQGAYVYDLTVENGFNLKGRVTHVDDDSLLKSGYYYGGNGNDVKRSLYIGDHLYTVSDNKILVNTLDDLEGVKEIKLPGEYPDYYGYME